MAEADDVTVGRDVIRKYDLFASDTLMKTSRTAMRRVSASPPWFRQKSAKRFLSGMFPMNMPRATEKKNKPLPERTGSGVVLMNQSCTMNPRWRICRIYAAISLFRYLKYPAPAPTTAIPMPTVISPKSGFPSEMILLASAYA